MVEGCRLPWMVVDTMVSLFSSEETKLGPPDDRIPWAHKAQPFKPQRSHICVLGPLLAWDQGAPSLSVPDVCLHTSSSSVATQKMKLTMGGSSHLTGWPAAWARDRTL